MTAAVVRRTPNAVERKMDVLTMPRDRVIEPGTLTEVVEDGTVWADSTGATFDTEADLLVDFGPNGRSATTFESLTPHIATVDDEGRLTRVSDGLAKIRVAHPWTARDVYVPISRSTALTQRRFKRWADDTLRRGIEQDMMARAATGHKPLFSTMSHGSGTYVRNVNCWLGVDIDLTGYAVAIKQTGITAPHDPNAWDSRKGGVAITPRHVVYNSHFRYANPSVETPTVIRFVTADNQVVERNVVAQLWYDSDAAYPPEAGSPPNPLWLEGDICVGLLDDELPESITPLRLLPDDWIESFHTGNYTNWQRGVSVPVVKFNQKREALSAAMSGWFTGTLQSTHYFAHWWYGSYYTEPFLMTPLTGTLIGGDSGSPICMILDGEAVLMGTAWSARTSQDLARHRTGYETGQGGPVGLQWLCDQLAEGHTIATVSLEAT